MEKKDLFAPPATSTSDPQFLMQYEIQHRIGEQRFGSECKHEKTKNGYCLNCFRKVVDRLPGRG